jgi:hypothetical protein
VRIDKPSVKEREQSPNSILLDVQCSCVASEEQR